MAGEPIPSPEKLEDPKGRQTSVNDQEPRGVRLVEPGLVWLIIPILDGTFAIRGNICVPWPSRWAARAEWEWKVTWPSRWVARAG